MPKLTGRRSTRQTYPASSLEVVQQVDFWSTGKYVQGRACCVSEHQGPPVFWTTDLRAMLAQIEAGELDSRAASVGLVGDDARGTIGWACGTCTDIILGLGRG